MGRPCRGRIDHRVSWQGLNLRPIPNVLSETGQVWIETVTSLDVATELKPDAYRMTV